MNRKMGTAEDAWVTGSGSSNKYLGTIIYGVSMQAESEDAFNHLFHACRLIPDGRWIRSSGEPKCHCGDSYFVPGSSDEVRRAVETAHEEHRDNPTGWPGRSSLSFGLRKHLEAVIKYNTTMELDSDSPLVELLFALAYQYLFEPLPDDEAPGSALAKARDLRSQ